MLSISFGGRCWHSAHFMSSIFRASKNISGLVNIEVTSPARLMIILVNVEPCSLRQFS